ncbi:hypothetical protein MSP7336_01469 [Mycobacterium shimoidei]|uniref:Uncharacterized protein n=1 Tax=Mycobacterium shimoidei TaxID=29313 RepID=A0A375YWB3_MYCSH|nr:hypothetical protein [Mycobacterium shimoidei]SRX93233.1 hypothetical protein MSP7336_01469 [Mycobacterium shimoidei]
MGFDRSEWLAAIIAHYGGAMVTPVDAATEILLGKTDADSMAESINRRGRKVGDDVMATTTAADCADAVEELISLGFLESVFSADCPSCAESDCNEHVLELRLPERL